MTLTTVHGPYTLIGLYKDMVYGPEFRFHLVLKEPRIPWVPCTSL